MPPAGVQRVTRCGACVRPACAARCACKCRRPRKRSSFPAWPRSTVEARKRGPGGTGARLRASALAPGRRRLVAGRAADERHDGRRGHAPARVPGRPPCRRDRALGRLDPLPAARRRHLGELPRRPRRAVDDDRGLLGAAARRRRARGASTCAAAAEFIRAQGGLERARVFTHVWLALFGLWSWERVPALPPEIVLLPGVGAAERLRLRLLGAPDDRRAVARQSPPAGAPAAVRPRRAAPPGRSPSGRRVRPIAIRGLVGCAAARARWLASAAGPASLRAYERRPIAPVAPARARPGRALDRAPPGGRRLVGRHPAARGSTR